MNIRIFNKKYWLRRFGEQREVKGYLTNDYKDYAVSLHIHPTSTDTLQALPEGERSIKRLEGHGNVSLNVGNQETGMKGDLLFYMGRWYECVSSQLYDHTMLAHYNYQFVQVPLESSGDYDISDPPTENPDTQEGGGSL